MESQAFEQILATTQAAYDAAKSFSNWVPPEDGPYIIQVKERSSGLSKDNTSVWTKLTCVIQNHSNPEVNGREWGAFYFSSKAYGFLKDFLAMTIGQAPTTAHDAFKALDETIGMILMVEKSTVITPTKKEQVNTKVIRVIDHPVRA